MSPIYYGLKQAAISKVPEVTLVFWIIKIVATTLGETGGNSVTMTLNWGFAGTAFFFGLLVVLVVEQILAKKFHPFLYWAAASPGSTPEPTRAFSRPANTWKFSSGARV